MGIVVCDKCGLKKELVGAGVIRRGNETNAAGEKQPDYLRMETGCRNVACEDYQPADRDEL